MRQKSIVVLLVVILLQFHQKRKSLLSNQLLLLSQIPHPAKIIGSALLTYKKKAAGNGLPAKHGAMKTGIMVSRIIPIIMSIILKLLLRTGIISGMIVQIRDMEMLKVLFANGMIRLFLKVQNMIMASHLA